MMIVSTDTGKNNDNIVMSVIGVKKTLQLALQGSQPPKYDTKDKGSYFFKTKDINKG